MFSTITQKAHIMSDAYGDFIGGKYLYDTDKRALYQIKESLSKTLEWTSLKMDFGTHKRKMITAIGITSNVNGFFYAFGETGNRWFYVKVGSNNKKMNLVGKQFYFSFAPSNNDMILKDFKINYIILED